VKHPAKFSAEILPVLYELCAGKPKGSILLDPFAGTGMAALVAERCGYRYMGVEIEPEWASLHPNTICADSATVVLSKRPRVICTSPAYGNRMADQYLGSPKDHASGKPIKRSTYAISLGRRLAPENGAGFQWGTKYKDLHERVWTNITQQCIHGTEMVLNVSDHERGHTRRPVVAWHVHTLEGLGWAEVEAVAVSTRRFKNGANRDKRPSKEWVIKFVL
jgi:hypothetical protein